MPSVSERLYAAHARFVALVETWASADRIRAYTRLMAAVALLGGVLNLGLGKGMLDFAGNVKGADFLAFYTGTRLFLEGRLDEAYEFGGDFRFPAQLEFQRELLAPQKLKGVHPFVNPPYAVVVYLPFGALDYPVALALWWSLGLLTLVACAALLRHELGGLQRWPLWQLLLGTLLFFPTIGWFGYGQITPLTLLIYTGTFVLLRRERDLAAGVCLGCMAYKPQLAFVLGVVLLVCGRWRAVIAGGTTLALWLGMGWLLAPDAMARYAEISPQLIDFIRYEGYPTWGIHSLFGFTSLLLGALSSRLVDAVALLLGGCVMLFLAVSWWRAGWQPGSPRWDLLMAVTLTFGLIVSPHLFLYDLMLLLLPFGIVLARHGPSERGLPLGGGPLLAWSVAVWFLTFLGSPLSSAQVRLTDLLGIGVVALQLSTLAITAWAITVARLAERDWRAPVPG